MSLTQSKKMALIFICALLIRGLVFIFVASEPQVVFQPDSGMYVALGQGLLHQKSFSYFGNPEKLDAERTPGYPFFLAVVFFFFGNNPLVVVVIQILIDCLTCVLIYFLSEHFSEGSGLLSGLLAVLNLGMITYAHFILNDTLFLFLFTCGLLFLMRSLGGGKTREAVLLGLFLGLATLVRPVGAYLALPIALFMLIYFKFKLKVPVGNALKKSVWVLAVFFLTLTPWLARNYVHFDRFKLSSQEGEQLLQYIVPFSWQYSKGMSFIEGMKKAGEVFNAQARERGLDSARANPFEVSDLRFSIGREFLRQEPLSALGKAWLFGMAKNLLAPAVVDFSYLLNIKRPHFFYTAGKSVWDRCWNFITGMKGLWSWAFASGMIGLFLLRCLQLYGFFKLSRRNPWAAALTAGVIGYYLLISGPVGYAKYRLPFEPLLVLCLAIGIRDLRRKWINKNDSGVGVP